MAQGNLVVGGAGASAGGSKVQINHLSAGRMPDGATVERAVPTPLGQGDYAAARPERDRLRHRARGRARDQQRRWATAPPQALDGRVVRVRMPRVADARVAFMADIENLPLELAAPAAKVVINARTGSVVMNQAVHARAPARSRTATCR